MVMTDGFKALRAVDAHAGNYFLGVNMHPGHKGQCEQCMKYAVALLKGNSFSQARHLLCEDMKVWLNDIEMAEELLRNKEDE